jgi:hypothetical protein
VCCCVCLVCTSNKQQATSNQSNKNTKTKELYTPTANHIVVYNIAQHAFTKERFKTRRVLLCLNG